MDTSIERQESRCESEVSARVKSLQAQKHSPKDMSLGTRKRSPKADKGEFLIYYKCTLSQKGMKQGPRRIKKLQRKTRRQKKVVQRARQEKKSLVVKKTCAEIH